MNPVTPAADPGPLAPEVGVLNALLSSELAAVATYEQTLAVFQDHPFWRDLRAIRHHHQSAAGVLRDQVLNLGGEPADVAGSTRVCDSASPPAQADDRAVVLEVLRVDEERRLTEYERALERDQMPDECRFAIRTEVLPRCHEHIDLLSGMASALARKG